MQHRFLRLVGQWSGDLERFGSAVEPNPITLTIRAWSEGILIDLSEERPEGRREAHAVVTDEGFWWFDSDGFTPDYPGAAGWQDDMLVLERTWAEGRSVIGIVPGSEYVQLQWANADRADAPLAPYAQGQLHRSLGQ